jgi:hypothetical protein
MTTPTSPDPFGRGLRVDDGDLVLDGGDLAEVTGIANLTQALTLRVLTPFGSDRRSPSRTAPASSSSS